jgi:hypothetical protein
LTPHPKQVRSYALYLSNKNKAEVAIDRVDLHVKGNSTILAVGPTQDSQSTTISLAKDRWDRHYVYHCAQEDKIGIDNGEAFRPIYLTIAGNNGNVTTLYYTTIDQNNNILTDDSLILTDPLSIVRKQDPLGFTNQPYLLAPFPNPTATATSFQVHLDEPNRISLTVSDGLGKQVSEVATEVSLNQGDHVFTFTTSELSSGTYYVTLRSTFGIETKTFKVIK